MKGFVNYFEHLGKLLQSGKAWESFLSFIFYERFYKQQERFCQSLFKSGKAFKNSRKGFSPKFSKITLGKERERKAFSPSGYQQKSKSMSSPGQNYFFRYAMRHPVLQSLSYLSHDSQKCLIGTVTHTDIIALLLTRHNGVKTLLKSHIEIEKMCAS